jgi:flagellar assembly factor FliW
VKAENVFLFPEGVPAFENVKRFVFLSKPETQPFFFMQALEPKGLSFVCIDPFLVCPAYRPNLSEADVAFLGLERPEDAFVAAIVTVTPDPRDFTANLQGPIVVNTRKSIGRQVVSGDPSQPLRYRLWDALEARETGAAGRTGPA